MRQNKIVIVNSICIFDCDNKTEYNSSTCSTNGDLTCDLCMYVNGWAGNNCSSSTTNNVSCPIGPNGKECSGRGQCGTIVAMVFAWNQIQESKEFLIHIL